VNGAKNAIEEFDIIFVGGVLTTMKFNLKNRPKAKDYPSLYEYLEARRKHDEGFEAELREKLNKEKHLWDAFYCEGLIKEILGE